MILELCKGVHCVDLDESFQTHIFLQKLASIQQRTSPLKFAFLDVSAAAAKTAVSTEPGVGPTSSSSPGGRTSMGLVGYPLYLQDIN